VYEDPEVIAHCHMESRRLRQWPHVVVNVKKQGDIVAGEFHMLVIEVRNIGYGTARHISVRVANDNFEGDAKFTQNLSGLIVAVIQPGHGIDHGLLVGKAKA